MTAEQQATWSPPIRHPPPVSWLSPQAKQSLATLTKDVPKRHSLAMPGETVLNGNQEWVVQADLPLTAAIRQSQQTLYHSHPPHPADRQGESCPGPALPQLRGAASEASDPVAKATSSFAI